VVLAALAAAGQVEIQREASVAQGVLTLAAAAAALAVKVGALRAVPVDQAS
jgi:outer membrane murein-binding lipoprotein Lpp